MTVAVGLAVLSALALVAFARDRTMPAVQRAYYLGALTVLVLVALANLVRLLT